MQEINWGNFKAKFNGREQAIFQWLCYLLFCQEFNQPLGIKRYENHAGIETSPIRVGDDWVGWQAKFYDTRLSEHTEELKSSITTAKERHPELTKLVFYTNRDFGQDKKKTDPQYKTDIEALAKSNGVSIIWKTASFFESPIVALDNAVIAKHFFDYGKSIFDLIEGLKQHSSLILQSIRSNIQFADKELKIDRSQITNLLYGVLKSSTPIVLSGEAGVGKTAVIKDLSDLVLGRVPLFIFKATEFNSRSSIKALFSEYGDFSFSDLAASYVDVEGKCVVIDSAEKLADIEELEVFQEFLGLLLQHKWNIIFTTRRGYLDDLKYLLVNLYGLVFQPLDIPSLTPDELASFAKEFSFALPNNYRMLDLIRNPFYLNEYLQNYDNLGTDVTYSEFKDALWDKQIAKSSYTKDNTHIRRGECFLAIAQRRANEGNFFVRADGLESAILSKLVADEIIGYDKKVRAYFITHDIYEEWALEKIIEAAFYRQVDANDFYQELGASLPIRRAFRHWLSDKLLADKAAIKSLVESTIGDDNIPSHWRDEVLVSVLLSNHSKSFFELFEKELLAQDSKLLIKITFLLRIACKEIDDDLLKLLGIPRTEGIALQTLFTKPKGSGWGYIIGFINSHKAELGLNGINSILGVLEDWNSKFRRGKTTRNASQIALFYYEEVAKHGRFGYGSDSLGKRIIKVILNGSFEIKDELSSIIDKIVSKKQTSTRDKYYDLAQAMLSSIIDSYDVANAIPEKIISLADIYWMRNRNKEGADRHFYASGPMDVEDYFGLSASHFDYSPSSAYQTPIFQLLRVAPDQTIDFIITLTNKAVAHYAASSLSENEMEEVEVFFDDAVPIKQYISCRLWEAYRGSHVSTSLLESIHMALEKWLLEYAKTATANDLEKRCMYLLKNSKSASITAVITSVVLAHPYKLFNVAAVLFKTKKFFLYDTTRFSKDRTHKSDLEMFRDNFPSRDNEIHQKERIEACDDEHRSKRLEDIAVQYQLFMVEGENEEDAIQRQRVVWDIFDNYYKQLPDASNETDSDKTWRLYLARMDRRGMQPSLEQKDGQTLISLNPQLDPELKKFSEDFSRQFHEVMKHTSLKLWSKYRWKQEEDKYREYEKYENDPRKIIEETKEVLRELEEGDAEFDHATPAYACAVLTRDYLASLDEEDKKFCKEVIYSYAGLPLQDSYDPQFADGVEAAVDTLPLLFGSSADDDENIKLLLFLILFDNRPVGMNRYVSDYAMRAVLHRMWEVSFKDAHSIFLGYLLLRPKYETLRVEIRKENFQQGVYQASHKQVMDAFLEKYEDDLENIVANRITYNDLPYLNSIDLYILEMAFVLLPYKTENEDHKQFLVTALPLFAKKLPNERDRDKYSIGHRFFEKYASFILTSKKGEIDKYLKPFIDGFTCSQHMADFFSEFVSAEDRLQQYEEFWTVWHQFYPNIVKLCKEQGDWRDTDTIVHNYLLAWPYWRETAKEWHSLKDRERSFFKKVADDIGFHPAVLYSLSKLLNEIGSNFIDDGIIWLSSILVNNPALSSEDLERNTIYYLENVVRRCVLSSRHKVRTTPALKKRILIILNFLIEKGSVAAYLTREDIL